MKHSLSLTTCLLALSLLSACGQQSLPPAMQAARLQSQTARPQHSGTVGDIAVVEKTTVSGTVRDSAGRPLNGVSVEVRSLNSAVPYIANTKTVAGTFALNNAPAGIMVEVSVTFNQGSVGMVQSNVGVLKSNAQGDPNANHFTFTFG